MLKLCHKLNDKGTKSVGDSMPSGHNHISRRYAAMTEPILSKICSKCKIEKPLSEFHKDKNGKYGVAYYCKLCRKINYQATFEKISERGKEYYKSNIETIKEKRKVYYQINHEKEKMRRQAWYKANAEQERVRKKVQYRANSRQIKDRINSYSQTETGKAVRLKAKHKYRAKRRNATVEDFLSKEIFERDGYICQLCSCKTRPNFKNSNHPLYPNLDHIIPLSKGGDHSKLNTQCLCRQCNIEKNSTGTGDQLRLFG
jgi:5-methylcytosine-specific restriction endonuclease McrA